MKHVVEVKYTNPSHEHVSFRNRVETVNRVVEAQSADEALNRAANQQRALGFRIQSANILEQKVEEPTTEILSEEKGTASYPLLKPGQKLKPMKLKSEEVEEVDEANMRFDPEAAARPKSSDVKNFLNRDKNPRAAAASKKYIRRMTKLGGLGPNQTKKDTETHMKAHFEEVEQVDEAKVKMTDAHKKAAREVHRELKSDDQQVSQVFGDRIRHMHNLLRTKYGKNWRSLAGIKEEVEQVDEAKLLAVATFVPLKKHIENKSLRNPNAIHIPVNPSHGDKSHREKFAKKIGPEKAAMYKLHGVFPRVNEEAEQVDEARSRVIGRLRRSYYGYAPLQSRDDKIRYQSSAERSREINVGLDDKQEKKNALKKEEVVTEAERESGYKMPAHVAAAQKKFDLQAVAGRKNMQQAGTMAAKREQEKQQSAQTALKKEEVEQVDEKMNLATAKMGDVVKDFYKSKAPQFAGKSMEKRREMAVAAKLSAEREAKNEAVDPGSVKVVNKRVKASKAAEKMIKVAKGKVNKVDLEPKLELERHPNLEK